MREKSEIPYVLKKLEPKPYPLNLFLKIFEDEYPDLQLTLSNLSSNIFSNLDFILSGFRPRDKEMLIMRFKEHKTYQEIGDIYGISRQAVEQNIQSTIRKIRKSAYFDQYIRKEIIGH